MKKSLICVLCLLFLLQACALASIPVRIDETSVLLTHSGEEMIAPCVFSDIRRLSENVFAAKQNGSWALIDESGEALTDFIYDDIRMKSGAILVTLEDSVGMIDSFGHEILPAIYSDIVPLSDGAWVMDGDGAIYRLDSEETAIAEGPNALRIGEAVCDGLLLFQSANDRRFGYMDENGAAVIEPVFDYAETFRNGRAKITRGNGCGVIDPNGGFVLPPIYDALEISANGFILAMRTGEGAFVFDWNGEILAEYRESGVTGACLGEGWMIRCADWLRVFDAAGNCILETLPETAVFAGIGGALIVSEGMWGESCVRLVDGGEPAQDIFPMGTSEGAAVYARLEVPAARYTNDLLNEVQISTDMDSARYGLTDAQGRALTGCDYISVEFLEDDRFLARTDDAWQMIDAHGKIIWQTPAQTETNG